MCIKLSVFKRKFSDFAKKDKFCELVKTRLIYPCFLCYNENKETLLKNKVLRRRKDEKESIGFPL